MNPNLVTLIMFAAAIFATSTARADPIDASRALIQAQSLACAQIAAPPTISIILGIPRTPLIARKLSSAR